MVSTVSYRDMSTIPRVTLYINSKEIQIGEAKCVYSEEVSTRAGSTIACLLLTWLSIWRLLCWVWLVGDWGAARLSRWGVTTRQRRVHYKPIMFK